jgi:hypothetical protein
MPAKFSPILHDTHREPYEGHKGVAPVLASAALEDAMKKLATKNGITLSDDSGLSRIIAAPKPARVIGGTQAAMLSWHAKTSECCDARELAKDYRSRSPCVDRVC